MKKLKYKNIKAKDILKRLWGAKNDLKGRIVKQYKFAIKKRKKVYNIHFLTLKTIKIIFLIESIKWVKKKEIKRVKNVYSKVLQKLIFIKKIKKRKKKRGIFTDVYSLGYKFYKKLRSKLREYKIKKKKREKVFLPQRIAKVKTIKKLSLVKIKDLREIKANKRINIFLIFHKKIENILEKGVEKEWFEEKLLRRGVETTNLSTDHDSELNLYLCELFLEKWISFCWYKTYLIKSNLLLYRNHARSLQLATKRVKTRKETRKEIIRRLSRGVEQEPMFKSIRPTDILKRKKKKTKEEDWYETWENFLSLIKVFDAINARERKLKEKARKVQENKKKKVRTE